LDRGRVEDGEGARDDAVKATRAWRYVLDDHGSPRQVGTPCVRAIAGAWASARSQARMSEPPGSSSCAPAGSAHRPPAPDVKPSGPTARPAGAASATARPEAAPRT